MRFPSNYSIDEIERIFYMQNNPQLKLFVDLHRELWDAEEENQVLRGRIEDLEEEVEMHIVNKEI